uniref:F-box domain-containing protein n=1 Tax=Oryza barthii TaxID=65489 RepID=A0A0D3H584_9ORYZ
MAGTERSRRRREGKLRKAWRKEAATAGPTSVNDVPDEVLELVLLRLGDSLALLRAAAACKRWRRLVADAGFLARFRSLHAPHVVGHYHVVDPTFAGALRGGNHVFVPERSPSPLDRRRLSLDFLPEPDSDRAWWELADTRGGLVLLYQNKWNVSFPDMVVCEPLTRRHQGILRPQETKYRICFGVFLIDGAAADETGGCISMSNFRVLSAVCESETSYWYYHGTPRPRAYVFSSGVDEFSLVTIPAIVGESYHPSTFRVIGGGNDGTMRVVRLIGDDLKIFTQLKGSGGEWVVEKLVRLPVATRGLPGHDVGLFHHYARIVTENERYILVTPRVATWLFSVEVETPVVEREHVRNKYAGAAYTPAVQHTTLGCQRLGARGTHSWEKYSRVSSTSARAGQQPQGTKNTERQHATIPSHGDDGAAAAVRPTSAQGQAQEGLVDEGGRGRGRSSGGDDDRFLRSFRSLHGARHVVGRYHTVDPCFGSPPSAGGSSVVFVPSSPLVIGVDSRFFSLDFLPDYDDGDSWSWELVDSRGGLLLFSKKRKSTSRWAAMADARGFSFPDLVVCEPLTRRYQGIASPVCFRRHPCLGVFLLDGDAADADDTGSGGIGMSNFRVVAALHDRTWQHDRAVPLACVFTSGSDGGWRVLQSAAASAVDLPERFDFINFAGRAGGCLYWGIDGEDGAMLVLDEATMRFSIDMFPETIRASYDKWTFRVIDGGDDGDALRVVRVMRNDLKVFAQLAGSGEWVVERLVSLPEATRELPGRRETYFRQEAKIVAANAAYVLLTPQEKKRWLFSVELETGKVERRHERNRLVGPTGTSDPFKGVSMTSLV